MHFTKFKDECRRDHSTIEWECKKVGNTKFMKPPRKLSMSHCTFRQSFKIRISFKSCQKKNNVNVNYLIMHCFAVVILTKNNLCSTNIFKRSNSDYCCIENLIILILVHNQRKRNFFLYFVFSFEAQKLIMSVDMGNRSVIKAV